MKRTVWGLTVALIFAGIACNLSARQQAEPTPTNALGGPDRPSITISAPASGSQVTVGQTLQVQSLSTDTVGVTRVEMQVDGVVVRSDTAPDPNGQQTLALLQNWLPTQPGDHVVTLIAYRADGTPSDPAVVTITVVAASSSPAPSLTVGPCTAQANTDVNVRSGPGTLYPILGVIGVSKTALVTGRNVDSTWWQISYSGGSGGTGWLAAQYSTLSGDCSKITVAYAPPPPPTKTSTATPSPTATITPTISTPIPADLVVTLVDMPTTLYLSGGKVTVSVKVTIKNNGGQIAKAFNVFLYPLGKGGGVNPIDLGIVASLDPGESLMLSQDVTYTAVGPYIVEAFVDPNNTVGEGDEGNNVRTLSIQVSPPPTSTTTP